MGFTVVLCPYGSVTVREAKRVLCRLYPGRIDGEDLCHALSVVLILIGLLPVLTIPIFHIGLLFFGSPPLLICCIVSLAAGLCLRKHQWKVKVKKEYLAVDPDEYSGGTFRFNDSGVEVWTGERMLRRMDFSDFKVLARTKSVFHLITTDRRLVIVPIKDFQTGLPAEFGDWIAEKTGRPVEHVK